MVVGRRLRQTRGSTKLLSFLVDSATVAHLSVEEQEALRFLMESVSGLLPDTRVTVSLIDENATYFLLQQANGDHVLGHCHPMMACTASQTRAETNAASLDALSPAATTFRYSLGETLQKCGSTSGLNIPLEDEEGSLGVLHLEGQGTASLPEHHVSLLRHFANVGVLALRNHRMVLRVRQYEQMCRELVENTSDLFIGVDTSGRLTTCNSRASEVLGYRAEELIGESFLQFFPSYHMDRVTQLLKRAMEDRQPIASTHVDMLARDGRPVAITLTATAIKREGRVAEWLLIAKEAYAGRGLGVLLVCPPDRLAVLNTVPVLLAQSLDPTSVPEPALRLALQIVAADAGCFYSPDPSTSLLRIVAHSGISERCLHGIDQIKPGECLIGYVAQSGERLVVKSIEDEPRLSRSVLKGEGIKSSICVPIKAKAALMGVIAVFSKSCRYFTSEDVEVLTAIGHQISAAMENAQLHERNRQQTEKLNRSIRHLESVSRTLSAMTAGPEVLSEAIAQAAAQLIAAPMASVVLLHNNVQPPTLWWTTTWPHHLDDNTNRAAEVMVSMALQKHCPFVVEDFRETREQDSFGYLASKGIVSGACVPLAQEESFSGGLVMYYENQRSFDRDDVRILQIFAHQVAITLRNSVLYMSEREKVARLNQLNQLVNDQKQILEQSEAVHKQLTDIALRGEGVQGIAETLARLISNPVMVDDRFGGLVAQAVPPDDTASESRGASTPHLLAPASASNEETGRAVLDRMKATRRLTHLPDPQTGIGAGSLTAPVVAGDDYLGSIKVLQNNRKLSEVDLRAVEHAATVVALEMMRQRTALEAEQRLKGDFLREFLTSRRLDMEDVRLRSHCLGYDLAAVERVMIVGVDERRLSSDRDGWDISQVASQDRTLSEVVRKLAAGTAYSTVIPDTGESTILLLVLREPSARDGKDSNASALARQIKEEVKAYLPDTTVSIGMGSPCREVDDLRRSYREARQCLRLLWSLQGRDQILCFDQLGVVRMLLGEEGTANLVGYAERLLEPLIEYDHHHRSDLLRSLEVYLRYDCNLVKTAEALFVHPSTLKYRLSKIESLCNADIHDGEVKLNLQVALKILWLRTSVTKYASP